MKRRQYLGRSGAVGGAVMTAGLAGCTGVDNGGGVAGDTDGTSVLNMAHVPTVALAPVFIAQERGYFEDRDLDVEFTIETSGATATSQVAAGEFDLMQGAIGNSTFNAINQDLPIKVVADNERGVAGLPMILRLWMNDSHYEEGVSLSDLPDGANIGINTWGAVVEYVLGRELQANDMTWDDIEVTTMPFPDMVGAFESDSLDAAIMPDPNGPVVEDAAGAQHVAYTTEVDPNIQVASILMGEHLLEDRPDEARGFLEGYVLGIRDFYDESPYDDEIVSYVSEYLDIPADIVSQVVPMFFNRNGRPNVDSIMSQQEFHDCRGNLDGEVLPEEEVVDLSALEAALDEVGHVDEADETPGPDTDLLAEWEDQAPGTFAEMGPNREPDGFPSSNICN